MQRSSGPLFRSISGDDILQDLASIVGLNESNFDSSLEEIKLSMDSPSPPMDSPSPPKKPKKNDDRETWLNARQTLIDIYDDHVGYEHIMEIDGDFKNINEKELYKELEDGLANPAYSQGELEEHMRIQKKDDYWYVDDFFLDSTAEGRLPNWHSLAPSIMKLIVEICGRVRLQDAARFQGGLPIHMYLWLKHNTLDGALNLNGPVRLFDNKTSYYSRFGFKRVIDRDTEEIETNLIQNYGDELAAAWQIYTHAANKHESLNTLSLKGEILFPDNPSTP